MKKINERLKNTKTKIRGLIACVFITSCCNVNNKPAAPKISDKVYPPLNYRVTGALLNGKKTGLWITTDSSGKVEVEETFLDGKSFGELKMFENGILFSINRDQISNGDTLSFFEQYNPKGKSVIKGTYVNRKKKGIWLYYFNDGKTLKAKIEYKEKEIKVLFKNRSISKDQY